MKKFFEFFINGILYAVFPVVVFILLTSKIPVFGFRSFVVLTGSMEPGIPIGSIVFTHPTRIDATMISPVPLDSIAMYSIGDVISFSKGKTNVTHRIIDIRMGKDSVSYVTKGDANDAVDLEAVPQNLIIGKARFQLLGLGSLILFIRTVPGFLLLIVLPGLLYIFFEILNIVKDIESTIERRYASEAGLAI